MNTPMNEALTLQLLEWIAIRLPVLNWKSASTGLQSA
jgi:hypothetical protein